MFLKCYWIFHIHLFFTDWWAYTLGFNLTQILPFSQPVISVTQLCPSLCDPMDCSMPDLPVYFQLQEFIQTHVHWVSDAIPPSHLLSFSPPTFNLSQHQGLCQWFSFLHQITKVLKLCFSISPSNEYSGLISFRIDWLDLLSVQGTCKSLLQHHSLKTSILWCSAFFTVWLSYPYMTTGRIMCLTLSTFVGKVVSLLFNMLFKFFIVFLPRSKHLLISQLQSLSSVKEILEPRKIKFVTVSIVSPSICHEVMVPDAKVFVFWMLSFKPAFSLSSFSIKRPFSCSSLSAIRMVSSTYMRLLLFLPEIFISAYALSSLAFPMMHSAYS